MKHSDSVVESILAEASASVAPLTAEPSAQVADQADYDLIAIGASEEWFLKNRLFGSIPDRVADGAPCLVLMVRKHEPSAVSWLRRNLKRLSRRF